MPSATQELRRRFLTLDPTDADTDTFELSFSSETPVARQYGDEVLSHAAGAVDLPQWGPPPWTELQWMTLRNVIQMAAEDS